MAGPNRPPNERDTIFSLNGGPTFLGAIQSSGAAVNNATTATPFNNVMSLGGLPYLGTLAGKVIIIQSSVPALYLPTPNATGLMIATQTVLPPVQNTAPGLQMSSNVSLEILMPQNWGYLWYLPLSGAGTLLVWELA